MSLGATGLLLLTIRWLLHKVIRALMPLLTNGAKTKQAEAERDFSQLFPHGCRCGSISNH